MRKCYYYYYYHMFWNMCLNNWLNRKKVINPKNIKQWIVVWWIIPDGLFSVIGLWTSCCAFVVSEANCLWQLCGLTVCSDIREDDGRRRSLSQHTLHRLETLQSQQLQLQVNCFTCSDAAAASSLCLFTGYWFPSCPIRASCWSQPSR